MTDEDMAKLIGISRTAYGQKMKSGRFWPDECKKICNFFCKSFDYLFATEEEIDEKSTNVRY